jgi:hypothetical protein
MTPKFWMVYRIPGSGPSYIDGTPTKQHMTETEADAEVVRLAMKHPGANFAVLEAVYVVQCPVGPATKEMIR